MGGMKTGRFWHSGGSGNAGIVTGLGGCIPDAKAQPLGAQDGEQVVLSVGLDAEFTANGGTPPESDSAGQYIVFAGEAFIADGGGVDFFAPRGGAAQFLHFSSGEWQVATESAPTASKVTSTSTGSPARLTISRPWNP